jgi:hypothetical protein
MALRRNDLIAQPSLGGASVQQRIAGTVAPLVITVENFGDLGMTERLAGIVRQKILLGDVGHVFGFSVLREQMIIGLILVRTNIRRNRLIPFLGVAKERVDIEYYAAKRIDAMPDDLADGILGTANLIHLKEQYTTKL